MLILGIETSADETSAAVVEDGVKIRSNITASQIDIHTIYGGIVPEVSARSHIGEILPVIMGALHQADVTLADIDLIAVTRGPGLIGSLLIGVMTAKTLAVVTGKPIIGVNHIIAHALAAFLLEDGESPRWPILALTVSGGHTALTLYNKDLSFEVIGQTQDDAAGEAFDKVAKLLGLPYPGGPAISQVAESGDDRAFDFPVARMQNPLDFSFSGLKTAVLRQVRELEATGPLSKRQIADLAASFERAAVISLVTATKRAVEQYPPATIVVGGGVAANKRLRSELKLVLPEAVFVPQALCGDNAAMIAAAAFKMRQSGLVNSPIALTADSSLESL